MNRQAEHNEELRRAVNAEAVPGLGEEEVDEMGDVMRIDSPSTTNHFHGEKKTKLGGLAKLAIAGGLIATGAGLPMGGSMVLDAMKGGDKIDKPAPISGEKSDREYLLDLGD